MFCKNGLYFWLGPIYKLFKAHVNYALKWILRILGPIKFCKGPIKTSKRPLKFGNTNVFEWTMGHWSILRAHHITLGQDYPCIWFNSFLNSINFCHLLITYANSLDPDQDQQNVGPDQSRHLLLKTSDFFDHLYASFFSKKIHFVRFVFLENDEK